MILILQEQAHCKKFRFILSNNAFGSILFLASLLSIEKDVFTTRAFSLDG